MSEPIIETIGNSDGSYTVMLNGNVIGTVSTLDEAGEIMEALRTINAPVP